MSTPVVNVFQIASGRCGSSASTTMSYVAVFIAASVMDQSPLRVF